MVDPVVVESWHLPRALSDEALRLLTRLPMEEIEARLRGPAPAADGEVAKLVEAAIAAGQPVRLPSGTVIADPAWFESLITIRAAVLLERQALRPIPVSERLPEKSEMTDDDEVWVEYPGGEYPLGNTGDYDWEPHKWILSPIAKSTIRENRRWLPAHALPLPEVE